MPLPRRRYAAFGLTPVAPKFISRHRPDTPNPSLSIAKPHGQAKGTPAARRGRKARGPTRVSPATSAGSSTRGAANECPRSAA